jgi:transcriptional regulator with GAF, ATPase, and Fis domain
MDHEKKSHAELLSELKTLQRENEKMRAITVEGGKTDKELLDQQRTLQLLTDFDEGIMNLQVNRIIGQALDFIASNLDVSRVSLALVVREEGGFRLLEVRDEVSDVQAGRFIPFAETILSRVIRDKSAIYRPDIREDGSDFEIDRKFVELGFYSDCIVPLITEDECLGTLNVAAEQVDSISQKDRHVLTLLAPRLSQALRNAQLFEKVEDLKLKLELENEYLREEIEEIKAYGNIIGQSPSISNVLQQIELVAPTDASVLILGETGTGKELVAWEIHHRSQRKDKPMVIINCSSVPAELFESEFFGHVKGAFTGAVKDRAGRFQAADGGTLFLDEVGEIPMELQSKLLRIIQEGSYERVGEDVTRQVDVRIIAATNRDLRTEVESRRFREDLYYRLNVFPIEVSPLRRRKEDIPLLASHFLNIAEKRFNRESLKLTQASLLKLQGYDWPGNVRELQNIIERAVITTTSGTLRFDLPDLMSSDHRSTLSDDPGEQATKGHILTENEIKELERENTRRALIHTGGKIYGSGGAAEALGIRPTTLIARIKKMRLKKPER